MAITNTWKINNLERDLSDDYVTVVHYGVDATDGEHSQGAYGTVSFNKETSPSSSSFGTLDQATVVGWVLSEVDVAKIEEALAERIGLLANPVSSMGMPWAVAE